MKFTKTLGLFPLLVFACAVQAFGQDMSLKNNIFLATNYSSPYVAPVNCPAGNANDKSYPDASNYNLYAFSKAPGHTSKINSQAGKANLRDLKGNKKVYINTDQFQNCKEIERVFVSDKTFTVVPEAAQADFIFEYRTSKDISDNEALSVYFFSEFGTPVMAYSVNQKSAGADKIKGAKVLAEEFIKSYKDAVQSSQ